MFDKRIKTFARTVFQLFWQNGVTDTMQMFVNVLDIIYLKWKYIYDIGSFDDYETCKWNSLIDLDKGEFDDIYLDVVASYLHEQKRSDFSAYNLEIPYVEYFPNEYELFHLANSLFAELDLDYKNSKSRLLFGDIYDELIDNFGIIKHCSSSIPMHIAKLMCLLIGVKPKQSLYFLNCGMGELMVAAFQQTLVSAYGDMNDGKDIDGFTDWQPIFEKNKYYGYGLVDFEASENDKATVYLCAMNLLFHGVPLFFPIKSFVPQLPYSTDFRKVNSLIAVFAYSDFKSIVLNIRYCLDMLRSDGNAVILVPEGFLFRKSKEVCELRQELLQRNILDAVVSLPKGVLIASPNVKTSLIIISKVRTDVDKVWFCDLLNDGYVRKNQRNSNFPLLSLLSLYQSRGEENSDSLYAEKIQLSEIWENDTQLAVNQYKKYETKIVDAIDPLQILKELANLNQQINSDLLDLRNHIAHGRI